MNIQSFQFYKVLKNEDSIPYVHIEENGKSGFLAAADGLGGSGSFVHKLSEEQLKQAKEELKQLIVPKPEKDDSTAPIPEEFNTWLEELLAPLYQNAECTSAMWGSRILMARFVHYMLTHKDADIASNEVRKEIIEYVYKAMLKVKKEFKLVTNDESRYCTLPSTFVTIKFAECDKGINAEVVWAGDSRAYAILPDGGIKQLSEDDEDRSGAITNLFEIIRGEPFNIKLNYAKYSLPEKSVLFACSDGFFDLYDSEVENIGVESAFLEPLQSAASTDDFKQKWYESFLPTAHDDCSVAFAAFGFKSFEDLKKSFEKRAERIVPLICSYYENRRFLPYVQGTSEPPESYVRERAAARMQQISDLIIGEAISNPDTTDPTVTPEVKAYLEKLNDDNGVAAQRAAEEHKQNVCASIKAYLYNNPSSARNIFNSSCETLETPFARQAEAVLRAAGNIAIVQNGLSDPDKIKSETQMTLAKIEDDGNKIVAEIKESITSYESFVASLDTWVVQGKQLLKNETASKLSSLKHFVSLKQEMNNVSENSNKTIKTLKNTCDAFKKAIEAWDVKDSTALQPFTYSLRQLKKHIVSYNAESANLRRHLKSANESLAMLESRKRQYAERVNGLSTEMLSEAIKQSQLYFSAWAIEEFAINAVPEPKMLTLDEIKEQFFIYLKDSENNIFEQILDAFIQSSSPCVIDSFFNAIKLRALREYKSIDRDKINVMLKELSELVTEQADISAIKAQ